MSLSSEQVEFLNWALLVLQDPAEADKLLKIQRDLDETKIVLVSINHHDSDMLLLYL